MYEIGNSIFANKKTWLAMENYIGNIPEKQPFYPKSKSSITPYE